MNTTTILLETGLVDKPHSVFPHRRDLQPANLKTADANGYTKVLIAYSGVYFEKDEQGQWWRKHQLDRFDPVKVNINNPINE